MVFLKVNLCPAKPDLSFFENTEDPDQLVSEEPHWKELHDFLSSADHDFFSKLKKVKFILCMLGNFFKLLLGSADFLKKEKIQKIFQDHYYQSVKQFGSNSGQTFCRS